MDSTEIEALGAISRVRVLSAGESLTWELVSSIADGREQIVGVVYPADFIGRPFGGPTQYGVTALTDSKVCVFARNDFDKLANNHPTLEHRLLERTLDELDKTRRWMVLLGRKSAEQKLASFLIELSERLVEPGCDQGNVGPLGRFELAFSRQQIADILGLTIETISRQFSSLRTQGVIALPSRREVVILNHAQLAAQAS